MIRCGQVEDTSLNKNTTIKLCSSIVLSKPIFYQTGYKYDVMKIQTVLGPIDPEKLGVTLFHEHLIADFMCWWSAPSEASNLHIIDDRFGIEHISELRRGSGFIKDNYTLTDVQLAIKELQSFKLQRHLGTVPS